jgi:hypothetical protein
MQNLAEKGVKSVGGFFRAFDIAFFMPGAVVLLALWWFHSKQVYAQLSQHEEVRQLFGSTASNSASQWLAALVVAFALIIATFVAGLFCHALVRLWCWLVWGVIALIQLREKKKAWGEASTQQLNRRPYHRDTNELSLYLWNLSSLGRSLAVAFLLVPVIGWWPFGVGVLLWVPAGLVLALLAEDFRHYSKKLGRS